MTPEQGNQLQQASLARAQKAQQAQYGLDQAQNPLQTTTDQAAMDRDNAMNQAFGWAPFQEAVNEYQDKGGKVDLGSAMKSIQGLDSAGTQSQQPGQVVTDTGNPPQGGSTVPNVKPAPMVPAASDPQATPPTGVDGMPAPTPYKGTSTTLTQKNARMPASMKGLGY